MEIKINKDVRDYTESIFFGLSFRQCLFSFLACVVAIGVYFLLIDILGTEITSWICMLSALPFASLGFIKYQQMNTEQIVITAWRSLLLTRNQLVFTPTNLYYEILKNKIKEYRKESIKPNDKKLRKTKKTKQRKI